MQDPLVLSAEQVTDPDPISYSLVDAVVVVVCMSVGLLSSEAPSVPQSHADEDNVVATVAEVDEMRAPPPWITVPDPLMLLSVMVLLSQVTFAEPSTSRPPPETDAV